MNNLRRLALNVSVVAALACAAAVARADGPPTNLKWANGQIQADWPATPPAAPAGCWKPIAGHTTTGAGTYRLRNASANLVRPYSVDGRTMRFADNP